MLNDISIIFGTKFHAGVLHELHRLSFDQPWSEAEISDLLNLPTTVCRIAIDEKYQKLYGFILIGQTGPEAEILTIAVDPAWRNKSIGRLLLEGTFEFLKGTGAIDLFLEVSAENQPALALYEKLDFLQVGIRKSYYKVSDDKRVNALVLKKKLL
jgi:ribosomal-protein-alanine N-acetyltransferase